MESVPKESIYKVTQHEKKQICVKISLFCAEKYLNDISLISDDQTEKIDQISEIQTNYKAVSEKLYCNACNISFETVHDMRQHQWAYSHRVNKGWIKSKSASDEEDENEDSENEAYNEDVFDEEVEVSGDDVSDEDCDGKNDLIVNIENTDVNSNVGLKFLSQLKSKPASFQEACTFPTIYFQNSASHIIGIKRCVIFNKKNKPECQSDLLKYVNVLSEVKKCAVLMYSGGSFAGAIFDGNKQILSKTLKRYTTRRKQGGSQASRDNQGHAPKSAGAFLRRVNTTKLIEDIFDLLHNKWAQQISECGLILIWSAKSQRNIFGHEGMLNSHRQKLSFDIARDPRVRFISARVCKVNSTTLLDVYRQISTIEVYDVDSINQITTDDIKVENSDCKPQKTEAPKKKNRTKKKPKKEKEYKVMETNTEVSSSESETEIIASVKLETREDIEIRNKILNYVLNDSAEDLIPYINELKISKSCEEISSLLSAPLKTKNQSLLHIAVIHENINIICPLLQLGCDPVLRNVDDETPYAMAIRQRNKIACNQMSQYMFDNPTQYDYFAAKFPGGKDPLKELEKKKKDAEKKKQYKKERKQRQKQEEEDRKKEAIEKCERDQFLQLNDLLKLTFIRKVQRDQRKSFMLCFQCAGDISDIVPFSYCDYSFCGMDCLKKHRSSREK